MSRLPSEQAEATEAPRVRAPVEQAFGWHEHWFDEAVADTNALIDTCHERRACPRCGAPLGERCHSLARSSTASPRTVKHPHRERWGVPVR